ncbi:CBD9-like protein [Xylariaceae sp. FL1272]|nr:CBD9-like protein [Xylariaceae sp. FL1272]
MARSYLLALILRFCFVFYHTNAAIQYCHKDKVVNLCIGIVTTENNQTSGTDVYFTIGYEGSASVGWTAIGFGEVMNGSLMFVIISDRQKHAIVSVRTTQGHFEPQVASEESPSAEILAINSKTDQWQEYSFVCYTCDKWATFDPSRTSQPLIWARGLNQVFESASSDARLQQHDHYSLFWADMTAAGAEPGDATYVPALERTRSNFGTSDSEGSKSGSRDSQFNHNPNFTTSRVHGLLLALAFMAVFPSGAVLLITGYRDAFRYHVSLQILGSISSLIGIVVIAWPAFRNNGLRAFLRSHPTFGTLLMIMLGIQHWLGWRHHRSFSAQQRNTVSTFLHRWNGRLLLLFGALNTAFGLVFSHEQLTGKLLWGILAAIEAILFMIVVPELVRRKTSLIQSPSKGSNGGNDDEQGHLMRSYDSHE